MLNLMYKQNNIITEKQFKSSYYITTIQYIYLE